MQRSLTNSPADELEPTPADEAAVDQSNAAEEENEGTNLDWDSMSPAQQRAEFERLQEENAAKKKRREAGRAGAENRDKLRVDKLEADLAATRRELEAQRARDAQAAELNSNQLVLKEIDRDLVQWRQDMSNKIFDDQVLDELVAKERATRLELAAGRRRQVRAMEIEWTQARKDRIDSDLKKAAAKMKRLIGLDVTYNRDDVLKQLKYHVFEGPSQEQAGLYARIELDQALEKYIDDTTATAIENAKKGVVSDARKKAVADREEEGTDTVADGAPGSIDYRTAMKLRSEGKLSYGKFREAMQTAPRTVRAAVGLI